MNYKFLVETDFICDQASFTAVVLRAGIKGVLTVTGMCVHFYIKCSKNRNLQLA